MRKMKYSGIEWIGDIPEDGMLIPLKYLCKVPITDGTHNTPEYDDSIKGCPFLSSKDIKDGYINWNNIKYITPELHKILQKEVSPKRNDILLAKNGTTGIAALVDTDKIFDVYVTLAVIKPNLEMILPHYLLYIINSFLAKKQFNEHLIGIGVPNLHLNVINNTKIIIYGIKRQQKIVEYLDKKCTSLDSIIDKEQKLIEKLKDYKQSLITETVTKGLNPDASMKDSDVEWIGDIPEHWDIMKIKYVAQLNPSSKRVFKSNDEIGYAPMEFIKVGYLIPNSTTFNNLNSGLTYFENGDIIIAKVTPCFENGNIAIAENLKNNAAYGSSELFVLRCFKVQNKFLFYFMQNMIFKSRCISTMTGTGGLKRISSQFLINYSLGLPDIQEQQQIIDYLDEKCTRIDENISKRQALIEKLNEYKKSLIYEVVTGKMEV